ncbi:MFS transporter [Streptomyces roseirectus]|uniref:MFS transporter n=1 Tax=Streptomyces roseirectus TaxID=2768066 RepID=A0A7H0IR38_9ACTN|nr:MFS transporter [Streptomyces roseirectus]QNP75254.1 MFS transporter [Streptomyces roseirectus]
MASSRSRQSPPAVETVPPAPGRRPWLAVLAVAFGVFTVTTTETMPIGLLPEMAAGLGVSEGSVGLTVTLYGLFAGALAPFLTAATRRLDRGRLLVVVLAVFVVGNVLTATATGYAWLMLVRLLVGFIHGVLWAIVASVAVRLVPPERAVRATAVVFSGISLASVVGVPLGTVVGQWLDWRAAFWGLAACSAVALAATVLLVPPMPPSGGVHLAELPRLLRAGNLRTALAVTAIVVVGHYAAFTYVTPFLLRNVGVPSDAVGVLLLGVGVAGVAGNFLSGTLIGRGPALRTVLLALLACTGASMALLLLTDSWLPGALFFLLAWGFAYSALPVALQTLVFRSAPRAREAATSLYVLCFNISIALGALTGALALDHSGPSLVMLTGAAFCGLGLLAAAFLRTERGVR